MKKIFKKDRKVVAIVPTFNSWDTLKDCLKSLIAQTHKLERILVIDNASTDGTLESITTFAKNIKTDSNIAIFRNSKNLGVTGGRNRGIKEAGNDYDFLLFFDHDMVADKEMVKELITVSERSKDIGIATPKIYYSDQKDQIWAAGTGINLWTGQILFRGGKNTRQFEDVEEVQVAPASFLVKREVLNKIGGFDDVFFATYEDTDFCFRARANGFLTFYTPNGVAYHKIPFDESTSNKRLLIRTYFIGRNRVIFMKRYAKSFFIFLCFLPVFFLYYLFISIKLGKLNPAMNFIKGTVDGLKLK